MIQRWLTMAGAAILLAACGTYDVASVEKMANKGDGFAQALQKRYVERAKFEIGEQDWRSVDFFAKRGEMAAMGQAVAPQPPAERSLKVDAPQIKAGHDKLTAALKAGASKAQPDACALAQTWLEHWMEQSEEGHQMDHIAMARKGFEDNMPKCAPAKMAAAPAPAPAKIVKTYVVYFDFNKADITAEAKRVIDQVAKDQATIKPTNIFLAGHTDTSGSTALNKALSDKRAKAAAAALAKVGVNAKILDLKSHGEDMLAVKTADNVKEGKNRRVEIHFEK